MNKLTSDDYKRLRHNAIVLADDEYGDKVLLLTDQSVLKLFRVKRLISSANFYSPARRFAKNAKKLQDLSIPTVSILSLYKIRSIKRTAVHYQQLQGETVRDYILAGKSTDMFFQKLGQFLAHLHELGIFFRSAHLGNIVFTPEKTFGLIDISDMKIYKSPLNKNKRLRNLKHIFRVSEDLILLKDNDLIEKSYLSHCSITNKKFHLDFLTKAKKLKS